MIYWELFLCFLQVGLFSIGGGYAAIPLIQEHVVDANNWLTMQEFTDLVTIAEMTPGPIAINSATFVGIRVAGFTGAVVATLGCITPSLFIVSGLAIVYYRYKKMSAFQKVLATLRPAIVSLIASAGISILLQVLFREQIDISNFNWLGAFLFLMAVVMIRRYKKNPILVMGLCGAICLIFGVLGGNTT